MIDRQDFWKKYISRKADYENVSKIGCFSINSLFLSLLVTFKYTSSHTLIFISLTNIIKEKVTWNWIRIWYLRKNSQESCICFFLKFLKLLPLSIYPSAVDTPWLKEQASEFEMCRNKCDSSLSLLKAAAGITSRTQQLLLEMAVWVHN